MGTWGTIGRIGADIATGGGYEAYKHFYGDPANEQRAGYNAAGDSAAALGQQERDYNTQQGNTALGYFSGGAPQGPRPTAGPKHTGFFGGARDAADSVALTLKQKQWDDATAKAASGPISPDQALNN